MKQFFGIYVAAFLAIYASSTAAKTDASGLNPAEQWVVAQVRGGEIADLSKHFPDKEKDKRNLSAHFLEALLTGTLPDVKTHRHGVRIVGARVNERVDLENAQIPCEVWLEHCQFNASTTFSGASFAGTISFENSTFKVEADFSSMKVGRDAFSDAVFEGPVDFSSADIAGNFEAGGAKFQNKEKGASFSGMKVGRTLVFKNAVCEGPVNFSGADITRNFEAQGVKFQNKEKEANLNNIKVRGDAFFNDAVFQGPVMFVKADIAGMFAVAKAKFQSKEKEANFSGMKVGGYAVFNNAVCEGPVNFSLAHIASTFAANEAQFQNKEKEASFTGMKVGDDAIFNGAVFEGQVGFISADIASTFGAIGAKFQSKEKEVNFTGMKVGGDALFNGAVFEGLVSFSRAEIASTLQAPEAKFQNKEKKANFNNIKVGGYVFNNAVFEGPVDFSDSDFAWLDLSSASWPKVAAQFNLQGMSYKYIRAASEEPESHKALLKLADQSAYSADVYSNLETFFLRQGYRGDADRAFIAGKHRERKEYLYGLDWFGSWLLDWLVGYGRRPWQAGIPCAVLIALGCVLFSPKKMEPQKPEDTPRAYNRFWYSLDLFLPFINLQADDVWKPKTNERFLRHYVRLHVMLGWILIPIVLAAVTGLIK